MLDDWIIRRKKRSSATYNKALSRPLLHTSGQRHDVTSRRHSLCWSHDVNLRGIRLHEVCKRPVLNDAALYSKMNSMFGKPIVAYRFFTYLSCQSNHWIHNVVLKRNANLTFSCLHDLLFNTARPSWRYPTNWPDKIHCSEHNDVASRRPAGHAAGEILAFWPITPF
jgi:hypothetical protein